MNKLLYIGTGLHIHCTSHFTNIKEFVFIDTLPRSQHDGNIYNGKYFYEGFYNHKFVPDLIDECNKYGFELVSNKIFNYDYYNKIKQIKSFSSEQKKIYNSEEIFNKLFPKINSELIIFENKKTNQIIKYYISTNILTDMNSLLKLDIYESDGLIISGYHPDKKILNYLKFPIELYCYSKTSYYLDNIDEIDNLNNVIYWLFNNLNMVNKYFNKIYACEFDTGLFHDCASLIDMNQKIFEIKDIN